jgi:hypothetical protein
VTTSTEGGKIVWSRDDVSGDATYSFTNLYQSGAPQEAVKTTADAAFGALATWLSEQQRLVERAFEARDRRRSCGLLQPAVPACCDRQRRRPRASAGAARRRSQALATDAQPHNTLPHTFLLPRARRWSATR